MVDCQQSSSLHNQLSLTDPVVRDLCATALDGVMKERREMSEKSAVADAQYLKRYDP